MATRICDVYASWQKGAVENMNSRLRRDLPRKRDIDKMSDEELQDILLSHNLTPRKCLGYKTPVQAILKGESEGPPTLCRRPHRPVELNAPRFLGLHRYVRIV